MDASYRALYICAQLCPPSIKLNYLSCPDPRPAAIAACRNIAPAHRK